jgi:mono/diheme cytochrome c family protein
MRRIQFVIAGAALSLLSFAADEKKDWKLPPETAKLEAGEGVELVTGQCMICHSVDYISTQPPMNRAGWTAAVTKMREKFGAPIPAEDVDKVVSYLVKTYGTERSKPAER